MTTRIRLHGEAIGVGMTSQRVRDRLIERLRANGIVDERVLNAIRAVPRHLFVDEALATRAYEDTALPIGHGQTISQPWVVAKMTETLLESPRPVGAPAGRGLLLSGTSSSVSVIFATTHGCEIVCPWPIGNAVSS